MAAKNHISVSDHYESDFLKVFKDLCYNRHDWQVWDDLMKVMAYALSNSVGECAIHYEEREEEYKKCIERLGGVEKPAEIFSIVTMALEENPERDFLGRLFMILGLGSHWKGQFFTPYSVCEAMAEIADNSSIKTDIENRGWASVNDPACGAGATLIAFANHCRKTDVDYQNHVLFTAQDIDRTSALMCYIQLSLLGCAGYIVVGDSLCNPMVCDGSLLFPVEKEGQELFFTPLFSGNVWGYRRLFNSFDKLFKNMPAKKKDNEEVVA